MRLLQPESAVAGNLMMSSMSRWVTVGSCIRNTRDDRIDSGKSFHYINFVAGDDSLIDRKDECFFSMSRIFNSWSLGGECNL